MAELFALFICSVCFAAMIALPVLTDGCRAMQVLGLGTDTGDSAPSALLFFDHHRFLFNVGEGFQRFCIQHKIRMSRTSGIFATRSNTQGLGGLPGKPTVAR